LGEQCHQIGHFRAVIFLGDIVALFGKALDQILKVSKHQIAKRRIIRRQGRAFETERCVCDGFPLKVAVICDSLQLAGWGMQYGQRRNCLEGQFDFGFADFDGQTPGLTCQFLWEQSELYQRGRDFHADARV
jgi:hypothetical protein